MRPSTTIQDILIQGQITDILLEFAETAKEDLTTSDLQGIAMVKAIEIMHIVEGRTKCLRDAKIAAKN